jgi:hypothetical protein
MVRAFTRSEDLDTGSGGPARPYAAREQAYWRLFLLYVAQAFRPASVSAGLQACLSKRRP